MPCNLAKVLLSLNIGSLSKALRKIGEIHAKAAGYVDEMGGSRPRMVEKAIKNALLVSRRLLG